MKFRAKYLYTRCCKIKKERVIREVEKFRIPYCTLNISSQNIFFRSLLKSYKSGLKKIHCYCNLQIDETDREIFTRIISAIHLQFCFSFTLPFLVWLSKLHKKHNDTVTYVCMLLTCVKIFSFFSCNINAFSEKPCENHTPIKWSLIISLTIY